MNVSLSSFSRYVTPFAPRSGIDPFQSSTSEAHLSRSSQRSPSLTSIGGAAARPASRCRLPRDAIPRIGEAPPSELPGPCPSTTIFFGWVVMRVKFRIQRSNRDRVSFFFNPEDELVRIQHRSGSSSYIKSNEAYVSRFSTSRTEQYEISLAGAACLDDLRQQTGPLPINWVVAFSRNPGGEAEIELLKQTGDDDGWQSDLISSDWCSIHAAAWDKELPDLRSSMSALSTLLMKARNVLHELHAQSYNLLQLQIAEILRLNANTPPIGSPITIRATKTAILETFFIYIETLINLVGTVASAINDRLDGAPSTEGRSLSPSDTALLKRSKRTALEDKLKWYPTILSRLLGNDSRLDTSNDHWRLFRKARSLRNSITHVRLDQSPAQMPLAVDEVRPAVLITDRDLYDCACTVYWMNQYFSSLINSIETPDRSPGWKLNDNIAFRTLFLQLGRIAGISETAILKSYSDWGTSGMFANLPFASR